MKMRMPVSLVSTESEYRANLAGMNTFFGAVLGFVLAEIDRLDNAEFAFVLLMVSGIVISILYVSASKQKIGYSLLTVALILFLPVAVGPYLEPGEDLPGKLQITLGVWAFMSIAVEFMPRRPDQTPPA